MKITSVLLCVVAVLTAAAGSAQGQDLLESDLTARLSRASSPSSSQAKANEIMDENLTYSGIAVELYKTDNLLELFNPFAPPKYGSSQDNVLLDPDTGKGRAWKLFSIGF